MRSLTSLRSRLTCALVVSAAALFVLVPAASATSTTNYLALGDSLAYGYQAAKFQAQLPDVNEATFNTGYVNVFAKLQLKPGLQTTNLGCPGETSDSLIKGGRVPLYPSYIPALPYCGDSPAAGIGANFPKVFLHTPYDGKSQLEAAEDFLTANAATTKTISVDIGANDLLVFLEGCGFGTASGPNAVCIGTGLPAAFGNVATNLNTILARLQAKAPNARYVVLGLYNPYPGVINVGTLTGNDAIKQLNGLLKGVATARGARFANPLPVLNPSSNVAGAPETLDIPVICKLTGMCPGGTYNPATGDIHPTDLGYGVLGGLVWNAWR